MEKCTEQRRVSLSCSVYGLMLVPLPEKGTDTKQENVDWAIDLFTSFQPAFIQLWNLCPTFFNVSYLALYAP